MLIIIIGIAFVLAAAVPVLLAIIAHNKAFGCRAESPKHSSRLRYGDVEGYPRRLTHFYSGHNKLSAYIYGESNNKGLVVIVHGLGGGAEGYFPETMFFVDNGWRVFAFDMTGSHNSEGKGTKGLPQSAVDLDAALRYIADQNWNLPIMLYGHSWGGFAVTSILDKGHSINAVVSLAAFAEPLEMLMEATRRMGVIQYIARPYLWVYLRMLFGQNATLSAINGINSVTTPVLVLHGTADDIVAYDGASITARRQSITNPNAVFVTHDLPHNSGHINLLRDAADVRYVDELNVAWKEKWKQHNGNIPEDIEAELYAPFRERVSALDPDVMNKINSFFESNLNDGLNQNCKA